MEREALVEQSECLPDALKAQMRRRAAAKGLATRQRSAMGRKETLTANVRNGVKSGHSSKPTDHIYRPSNICCFAAIQNM